MRLLGVVLIDAADYWLVNRFAKFEVDRLFTRRSSLDSSSSSSSSSALDGASDAHVNARRLHQVLGNGRALEWDAHRGAAHLPSKCQPCRASS